MAAIDSLLRLIDTQRADGLQVRPGSPPALILGDQERSLSMPPLEDTTVAALLEDLLTGEQQSVLRDQGRVTLSYTPDGLGALEVEVLQEGERLSATFRATSGATRLADPPANALEVGAPPPELDRSADQESPAARPSSAGGGQLVDLLRRAASRQAADVFLSVGETATWRLHGDLTRLDGVVPTDAELEALFEPVLAPDQRERLARHGSVDLALELEPEGGEAAPRFRVALFRQARGLAAALRPVARRIPSLQELSLPSSVAGLIEYPHGLVLMTGPTGSGKSTTMAALIALLHQTRSRHVITLEDPIEYHYPPGRCLIHQRQLGTHVSSFADGLRAALRSAPDVILLGEMRDPETMAAALTAAETGHLVLSTLHCGNAAMAVDRIIDGFPQARQGQVRLQLSDVLRTVVSQRLVESLSPSTRLPVLEVLHVTHAVAALIREGRSHQIATAIQTGRNQGMVSLERALAEQVRAGRVSRSVAQKVANDPDALMALL
jgi:twitching motility protein PilT